MSFIVSSAVRKNIRLKIAIDGPAGSGKTLSSLLLAYGIVKDWDKVIIADTERDSALFYVGQEIKVLNSRGEDSLVKVGTFKHIPFMPPFSPMRYVELIEFVEKNYPGHVLIMDSISPEWDGEGGCLEIQTKLGGRFADWGKVTPLHQQFMDRLVKSDNHIICTMRTKTDYAVEQNDRGKTEVKKLGTKTNQREGVEYEFSIVFDVGMNHRALAGKDRTNLFPDTLPFQLTPATGDKLIKWANGQDNGEG